MEVVNMYNIAQNEISRFYRDNFSEAQNASDFSSVKN